MEKARIKAIKRLSKLIGQEIIRTKPVMIRAEKEEVDSIPDWVYTDCPILFTGFTPDGRIRYKLMVRKNKYFKQEFILPLCFSDKNWIPYKDVFISDEGNPLNQWKEKRIKRIRPTPQRGNTTFMDESQDAPILVHVAKHHMVVKPNDVLMKGIQYVLDPDFMEPDDWVLAEE